jgi:hypothetical protein
MSLPSIQVSKQNPHQLQTEDGKPFFMLGDTGWELLHKLTREEASLYLRTRAEQKFNMIWTNYTPECDSVRIPNQQGLFPFVDQNPLKLNSDYVAWAREIFIEAGELGLYIGLLPSWGDKFTAPWGAGPVLFKDSETCLAYGKLMAETFGDLSNILWVLGGDRPAVIEKGSWTEGYAKNLGVDPTSDWRPLWRAMAEGILSVLPEATLTYHPQGGPDSTSNYLHHEPWLDLNCMQSGHGNGRDVDVWNLITRDYELEPVKPTFDGEPCYEDHPVSPWPTFDPKNGYFCDYDVRRQIYRSVFAGGCGVIYGHHSVWHFASDRAPWINHAKMSWQDALHRPGAKQMQHLRSLLESAPFEKLVPDQSLIAGDFGEGAEHKRALRATDGSWAAIYFPHAGPCIVTSSLISDLSAEWYDPRDGSYSPAKAEVVDGIAHFSPKNDLDWVLVFR